MFCLIFFELVLVLSFGVFPREGDEFLFLSWRITLSETSLKAKLGLITVVLVRPIGVKLEASFKIGREANTLHEDLPLVSVEFSTCPYPPCRSSDFWHSQD